MKLARADFRDSNALRRGLSASHILLLALLAIAPASAHGPEKGCAYGRGISGYVNSNSSCVTEQDFVQFDGMRVPRRLVETILKASEATAVDPVYMMALADKESSFIPHNKASSSSAEGLFQFLEGTWLEIVKSFGAEHGLVAESAAIQVENGQFTIADDAMREHIIGLRRDPYLSALMAAEMLKRDRNRIERRVGRTITRSEFYLAHFFGVGGATRFITNLDDRPKQSAPKLFPAAAKANRALFYDRKGKKTRHLSVAEVYNRIDEMIDERLDRYADVRVDDSTVISDAGL